MMRIAVVGLILLLWATQPARAQTFDNRSVVSLQQAGLGDATIIAKVNSLPCGYDVSTDALIALKKAGVSDAVLAAMVERCKTSARAQGVDVGSADPMAQHAPGLYLAPDNGAQPGRMQLLRPSKASSIRISGNGSVLLPYVGRLIVPGGQSHVQTGSRHPVFYFYFLAHDRNVSDFGTPTSIAAQSPEEFSLVRFTTKGDAREVGIGKVSAYSARRGIDTKAAIRFQSTEIGETAFRIDLPGDLAAGEYAFVLTGANNSARVYDFSIP